MAINFSGFPMQQTKRTNNPCYIFALQASDALIEYQSKQALLQANGITLDHAAPLYMLFSGIECEVYEIGSKSSMIVLSMRDSRGSTFPIHITMDSPFIQEIKLRLGMIA